MLDDVLGLVAGASGAVLKALVGPEPGLATPEHATYARMDSTALRLYFDGVSSLRRFDAIAARQSLELAVREDSSQPVIFLALSEALMALGHEREARENAQKALDSSDRLSPEHRLWVEAHHALAFGVWDQAIERYRALTLLAPRNLEYRLLLARAQNSAGRPLEARVTLAPTEAFPESGAGDPRVDLVRAEAARRLGDHRTALESAAHAAQIGRTLGAHTVLAEARLLEARSLWALGRVDQAIGTLALAAEAFEETGDRRNQAQAGIVKADWLMARGSLAGAKTELDMALARFRELGDRTGENSALAQLGLVLAYFGEVREAEHVLEEALTIARARGDRANEARALAGLGDLRGRAGELSEAGRLLGLASRIFAEVGNVELSAMSRSKRAQALATGLEPNKAIVEFEEARKILASIGNQREAGRTSWRLGHSLVTTGDLDRADTAFAEAYEVGRELNNEKSMTDTSLELTVTSGRLHTAQAKMTEARDVLEAALSAATSGGSWIVESDARLALAELELASGNRQEGQAMLEELENEAREKGWVVLADQAAALLAESNADAGEASRK